MSVVSSSADKIWSLRRRPHVLLQVLVISFCVILSIDENLAYNLPKAPEEAPTRVPLSAPVHAIPIPAKLPLLRRHRRKHFSPVGAPSEPPFYGPLVTSGRTPRARSSYYSEPALKRDALAPTESGTGSFPTGLAQPPLSPTGSNCCKPDTVLKRGSRGCHCVYPVKLDLLLSNISQTPNWNVFLDELAAQLDLRISQIELINFYVVGLSSLNISMDITPHMGISFSASDASQINYSLATHMVHFHPSLVGSYKLLNFTLFEPPAPSPAPIVASPVESPMHQQSASATPNASDKGKHLALILFLSIGAGLLIISVVCLLIIRSCAFHEEKPKIVHKEAAIPKASEGGVPVYPTGLGGSLRYPTSTRFLAYEELKAATNNFEHASILGEGGFGRVFKGVLRDGTAVAIKRLTTGGQQGDKEFLVEVQMLSRLHHRNLVKLVGYYSNRDSSQNLLCYELVSNGSLEAWLHGPLGVNCPLDWDTRMKIALDAARGLAYLHEDSQPCVIHRDFKASNILLEKNFHAKVADFGLAKQAPEGRANYLSTRVMGTFGYVAPEYAMTGHLLVKSDVYSYGVVLLELLTGRKPVDMSQPSGQENLVTWSRPILRDKDRLDELADTKLDGKYPKEDFIRVCTIAAACVSPEASQRPTMGEVVQSLKMVQRVAEYQDSLVTSSNNNRPNLRQSSTTYESDGTSSMFSSGPYSGLMNTLENDTLARTTVFSEDLHEGR